MMLRQAAWLAVLGMMGVGAAAQAACPSCGGQNWQGLAAEACGAPGYGTLGMSPGCCEHTPSRADHIWDGYCQEKAMRHVARRPARRCRTCPPGAMQPPTGCAPAVWPDHFEPSDMSDEADAEEGFFEQSLPSEADEVEPAPEVRPLPKPPVGPPMEGPVLEQTKAQPLRRPPVIFSLDQAR